MPSSPLTFAMGLKKRCAPLGSQLTHFSSVVLGMPCSVLWRVWRTSLSGMSLGSK